MPRASSAVPGLGFVTSEDLMDELRRRSLGCLIATVRADEKGDSWRCVLKGSPILMGALSASLSIEIEKVLLAHSHTGGSDERCTRLRHPGAA